MAARMRVALGDEAIGPRLTAIAEANDAGSLEALSKQIEKIVAESEDGAAARQLRDLTGLTWDEAYALRSRWQYLGGDDKRRLARRLAFRRALRV